MSDGIARLVKSSLRFAPDTWALVALTAMTLAMPISGPAMQLKLDYASDTVKVAPPAIGLELQVLKMTQRIDQRTERVWRRLENQMRRFEQRVDSTAPPCTTWRSARVSED